MDLEDQLSFGSWFSRSSGFVFVDVARDFGYRSSPRVLSMILFC